MVWMTCIPLISSGTITYYLLDHQHWLSELTIWQWCLFYVLMSFCMALAITPTTFVSIVCGFFIGFEALPFVVLAYICASVMGYHLAKLFDKDFFGLVLTQYPKAKGILENIENKQLSTVILSRISPALPFALMNVVLAISKIKFWKFLVGGLIGMLPRTLLFIWIGVQANELNQAFQQKQNLWWVILPTILVFTLFYWLLKPDRVRQNIH